MNRLPKLARSGAFLLLAGGLVFGARQMLDPGPASGAAAGPKRIRRALPQSARIRSTAPVAPPIRSPGVEVGRPLTDPAEAPFYDPPDPNDPVTREKLIAHFLASLKTEDIPIALDVLREVEPADLAEDLSQRLVQRWAEANPREAAAWVKGLPPGSQRQAALDNLAITWARNRLADAIGWGQSLTDKLERQRALGAVANEAVRADPVTALQVAVGLPADSQRDDLVRRAATEWAVKDPAKAVAWAAQISDETLRAGVLAGEATAWADRDPESAAILAVRVLPAGQLLEDTVIAIVQRWAQQQPENAAAWVARFPPGPMRTVAIENLVIQWSQTDVAGAQQWLARQS